MERKKLLKLKLPDKPGVYFFKKGKDVLYIGKATSLRDRVRSYFGDDLIKTRGRLLVDMVALATSVDYVETDSVLEAFIKESELIKKYFPKYNTKEKDNKSFNYVVITKEDFPRVLVVRGRDLEKGAEFTEGKLRSVFGPYPHGGELREAMKLIRRIFPYRDSCEPCSPARCKPCFNKTIGLCPGVCDGTVATKQYAHFIKHIELFFKGKKKDLVKQLKKEMMSYAKTREFEKANEVKQTMAGLLHINDISLIKKDNNLDTDLRIESYDIAHFGGKDMVGVMTVMENGQYNKMGYRKFKIRGQEGADDGKALREVLLRRMAHPEWKYPDLIIVDGGAIQLEAAYSVIRESGLIIPIAAVVKDDKHKAKAVLGLPTKGLKGISQESIAKDCMSLNAETHRFAIKYHRSKRKIV